MPYIPALKKLKTLLPISGLTVLAALVWLPGAEAAENLKPGNSFRDCKGCPEMVVIPASDFLMGSNKGRKRELPRTRITIPRALAVSRYEVSFDEWEVCHAEGGCKKIPTDRGWGRGKRPVMSITLAEIREYMAWISKKTGRRYRLPSEAEWEYAARAGSTTEYWWGDEMGKGFANCRKCGTQWSGVKSAPVGRFKANAWGLFDVHGNVLEMVTDCWHKTLEGISVKPASRPNAAARW